MLFLTFLLSLLLLTGRSQAAIAKQRATSSLSLPSSTKSPASGKTATGKKTPFPTNALSQRVLKPRGLLPSGVVEVGGLPAPICVTRNGTNVQSTEFAKPTGVMWMPFVPFNEPGQVVYIGTDTEGIVFENVFFSAPASDLSPYESLLTAYSNSSGWSMTMPATIPNANISFPTIIWTATGTTTMSAYNLLMRASANCASDKDAPLSTVSTPAGLPFVNPLMAIPAITGCSYNASTTATWTTEMAVRTGEIIIPAYNGENRSDFWNQTGAVWTFSNGNDSQVAFDFPLYGDGGDNPSLFFTMGPSSTAVNFTIPDWTATPTGWEIDLSATTVPSATAGVTAYTITASAQYACTSDEFANPIYQGAIPCTKADPLFVTNVDNWIYRNVDLSLSNYWHNGPTRTTPSAPNVPGPTGTRSTDGALPKQLALQVLNVEVDCSLAGACIDQSAIDWCQADQNPTLPIWAYLALIAMSNFHTQMKNIYNLFAFAAITVGDWGLSFVNEFTDDVEKNAILTQDQVALAVTGTVVSVVAAFLPMVNFDKVGANVAAAESKIGSLTGGKGSALGLPKDPNAPEGDLDPATDPESPEGSDVGQFWAEADAMEAGEAPGPLNPGENWPQDFSYVDTRPARNPKMIPQAIDEEVEETRELALDIGRREATVLLGTIPGNVLTGSQTLWAKYDPNSVNVAYQGGLWDSFVGNLTVQMQTQLDLFATGIMTDPMMTDVLLTYLWGGTYISGQIDLTILQWFLRTDITARAINNVWNSYYAYVAFINLGDPMYGNSTPACQKHTAGPQATKFCGVRGVFYLYMLSQKDENQGSWVPPGEGSTANSESLASYPGQVMPYGLDKFSTDAELNLTASGPTEGSARAWNATGSINITAQQSLDMMNNIGGLFDVSDETDLYSVVGRLPGEWSLPVCNQGNNSWGANYMTSLDQVNIGYLPCACGYQGNETANFFEAIGITDNDLYNLAFYCCEGSLLFPNKAHSQVTVNANTGPGAIGLDGGVWPDDAPLYYGTITAKDIHHRELHCSSKGVLTPAPNTN